MVRCKYHNIEIATIFDQIASQTPSIRKKLNALTMFLSTNYNKIRCRPEFVIF